MCLNFTDVNDQLFINLDSETPGGSSFESTVKLIDVWIFLNIPINSIFYVSGFFRRNHNCCKQFRLLLHISSYRCLSVICRLSHSCTLHKPFNQFTCTLCLKKRHPFYRSMLLAMERSCRRLASVCASVRPSVTLVDCDHIRRARWNFITRLISPMSSLAARKISAI